MTGSRVFTTLVATALVFVALPALAAPVPADLSTWTVYNHPDPGGPFTDPGQWDVDVTGTTVHQVMNGRPTFFASPGDADGQRITASFTTPINDNDFIGFALGFSTDPADPSTDYLLVDWRQSDQWIDWGDSTGPVLGLGGLAVSHVTGVPTLGELWAHLESPANPAGGVEELDRGATLGNTGWLDSTTVSFKVEYTTTSLDVWVDGSHEISITGTFPAGPFALYNFSQPDVEMSGITFEPLNSPPEVDSAASDVTVNEGQVGSTSGSFTDPDDDPMTLSCSGGCSGFVDNGDGTWSWSQTLPEGPDTFDVTVTASDGQESVDDVFTVTVLNVAPVITSTSSVAGPHDIGMSLDAAFDFTDAGVLDTHTAQFDWGDGSSTAGAVTETDGSGGATGSHVYGAPGSYVVTVTVWDDDGASDTAVLGEVFVFDPDDFVTGGGWVSSPAGAWVDRPDNTGKATFGFVVRYDKSWAVRGSLEFQIHKGLNLHATSFDYLLISDGVAVFEGSGKVNGESGYSFRVVASDERYTGDPSDLFWIEITGPGGLVYGGAAYPAGLPIKGKGIQVHDR